MERDLNLAAADRRFRRDPWLGAWKQDEQATLGAGMFDRDPQKRLDELIKDDLAGHGLRGFDDARYIELLDWGANGRRGTVPLRSGQTRIKPIELPHLAVGAPAEITVPGIPEIGVGDSLDTARGVEPRRQLMGQALVLHEAVLASRSNGLLVQTHCIGVSPFEAGDLGRYQGVLIGESRRVVYGPLAQLLPVRRQEFAPLSLLVGRRVLVARRHRQRGVVKVVE